MTTKSEVEVELQEATGCKPKGGQDRQTYLVRLHDAIQALKGPDWDSLTKPAQQWANDAAKAVTAEKEIEDFGEDEGAESEGESEPKEKEEGVGDGERTERKPKSEKKKTTPAKTSKPAPKKEEKKEKAAPKKSVGRPLSEGKVEGIKYSIKKLITENTKIGVDELVKKLGGKMSKVTVSNVRADFRHSLRVLHQLGKLKGIDL